MKDIFTKPNKKVTYSVSSLQMTRDLHRGTDCAQCRRVE